MPGFFRDDRGNAIIEFIVIGIAVFMPLVYMVIAISTIHAANMASSQAVREATRAFMMSATPAQATAAAHAAARIALKNHGITASSPALTLRCDGGCLAPASSVEATLRWAVPLPWLPDSLRGPLLVPVSATHTLPIDSFRSTP